MTSISKNVYIANLDDTVNKYNTTYHRITKTKPFHVKSSTYFNFNKVNNKEGPKFIVGDHVRISKYKNFFAKGYISNWFEKCFVIKIVKNTVSQKYVISDLKGEQIVGTFYKKNPRETKQKEFRIEKVIQRKGDKLYVKWKGYDNSFNSLINKQDIA